MEAGISLDKRLMRKAEVGGEGNGNPRHSSLENPMDRGAWQATVLGVTRVGHDVATKERERENGAYDNFRLLQCTQKNKREDISNSEWKPLR